MKKTIYIMAAFMAILNSATAQDRRTTNTPAPTTTVTPKMRQEAIERDKQYEAQRLVEKQQSVQNTTLTDEDQIRLQAIQQKEYEATRKAEMEGNKTTGNHAGTSQAVKFDDTPRRDMSLGVDGMKNEAAIKAYNEQTSKSTVPVQTHINMDALTPEQRIEFDRRNEMIQKNQNHNEQSVNDNGSTNVTQRKPLQVATPKVQQDRYPSNNGGSSVAPNLTPEQRRIQEATQSGKSGARVATQSVQVPVKTEVRPASVSGNSTQQGLSPDQIAAFEKRAQFEKATSNGEAGRKQEVPSTPVAAPVKRAESQSGNAPQQSSSSNELSKDQQQFKQATQSGAGGKR